MKKKTVLITGASSGIGRELAQIFAREGNDLVIIARGEPALQNLAEKLKKQYGVEVHCLVKDLSKPQAAFEVFEQMKGQHIEIEVLVNNAGFGIFGYFWETSWLEEQELLNLNIVSATHLTKLFLPDMLKKKKGYILQVGSIGGFQPGPLMPLYYASKAYLHSFSFALAEQLRGTGVSLTVLAPGATRTNFSRRTGGGDSNEDYAKIKILADAAWVAEVGYRGMLARKKLVIPGVFNKSIVFISRLLPTGFVTRIVRKGQEFMR